MHVGVFCSSLGLAAGGLETVAEYLSAGLAGKHDVTAVVGRPMLGRWSPPDTLAGCRVLGVRCFASNRYPVRIVSGYKPGFALRAQSQSFLHAAQRNLKCLDVVARADVTLSFFELETVALSHWRRQAGRPHVSYFPGGIRWSDLNRDVSDLRIATSDTIARQYRREGFRIDGVVAPGVPDPWLNEPYHVRPAGRSLVYVGRLERNKGVELLLASMRLVAKECPDVNLTMVGGGPLLRWVRREVVIRGMSGRVNVLGSVRHDSVRREMQHADVLLFPTRYESFGVAALEAMAVGIPIVCSDLPVLRETTGDHCVTVSSWDPGVWKDAIVRLLTDVEQRRSLSQQGRERARGMTWSRVVEQFDEQIRPLGAG